MTSTAEDADKSSITGTVTNTAETTAASAVGNWKGWMDILFYVLTVFLFAVSFYVFIVLSVYLHEFLYKRRRSRYHVPNAGRANGYGGIALAMRFVAVTISALCLGHSVVEQVFLRMDSYHDVMMRVGLVTYGFVMMFSYLFFWLRQRVLYDAPAMRLFNSQVLRILSWISLVLLTVNSIGQIILTFFLQVMEDPTWTYISWLVGCIVVQGTLMALFLYPILKHRREAKKMLRSSQRSNNSSSTYARNLHAFESSGIVFGTRDSNIFTVTSYKNSKGSASSIKRRNLTSTKPMYRAARRCLVCAAVTFASDLLAGVFMIVNHRYMDGTSDMLAVFLFDFNLAVNSVFVIGCFSNWRRILFPKCWRTKRKERYGRYVLPDEILRDSVFVNSQSARG